MITEYYVRCAQTWVPCIDKEVFFSEINVAVQSDITYFENNEYNYMALCSGDLKEQLIDEHGKMLFRYSI